MRFSLAVVAVLYVNLFGSLSVAAPGQTIQRRDDPPSSSPAASKTFAFPTIVTASSDPPSNTNVQASSTGNSAGFQQSASPSPAVATMASNSSSDAAPTANAGGSGNDTPQLPIPPVLNAVFVVSGVLLLGSGLAYTFVGIKHKQIQVFLSAAYVAAIGISVLIIYILSPPVSTGQQGAYLAAIVLPGILLGGMSVLFKDVTEGLGCGVGGFALAMWLLTLHPGGLIAAKTGKAVFILVFTAAIFALSFSHHTRSYGLIGATAFGGATALILGVDCFAGVGLKEFWVYIWGVNQNIFPLGTTTYPMTKGMIAEISAIPIAAFFGILSQIKIWKLLETKREKRAREQAEKDKIREEEEASRGKDLLVQTEAEKMIWEQTYAEDPRQGTMHSDSGIGSEASASEKGSVKRWSESKKGKGAESNVEVYEMKDLTSPSSSERLTLSIAPQIVVSVAEEPDLEAQFNDALSLATKLEQHLSSPRASLYEDTTDRQSHSPRTSQYGEIVEEIVDEKDGAEAPASEQEQSWFASLKGKSLRPKGTAPAVIPLPFTVPGDQHMEDDASSVATAATSAKRMSKRFSSSSLLEKMTKNRLSFHKRQASDTSSVQAIADGSVRDHLESSSLELSRKSSKTDVSNDDQAVSAAGSKDRTSKHLSIEILRNTDTPVESVYFTPKNDPELLTPPPFSRTSSESHTASDRLSVGGSKRLSQVEAAGNDISQPPSEIPVNGGPSQLSLAALQATGNRVSKVVHTYRTNEWAKHISTAAAPEEDDILASAPPSPALSAEPESVTSGSKSDVPSSVTAPTSTLSEEEAQPSATNTERASEEIMSHSDVSQAEPTATKATWPKRSSRRQSTLTLDPKPESRPQSKRMSSHDSRTSARRSAMRSSSNSRVRNGKARQSTQAVATSPIQEDEEAMFVSRPGRESVTPTQATLLERRESMMSQTALVRSPSQVSIHKVPITNAMFNASRASLAQSSIRPLSTMSRRSSNPEPLNLIHQSSMGSMRSTSQPYSPPVPVRNYSPMPDLASPVMMGSPPMASPPMQAITHSSPVAPPDRPLHYRTYAPSNDLMTQRMAAWRSDLQTDSFNRRSSTLVDLDLEAGAAGQQWLANQRVSRQLEQANKHTSIGWQGQGMSSPPILSPAYTDPRAVAMAQSQAHQDVLRRMQAKARPK